MADIPTLEPGQYAEVVKCIARRVGAESTLEGNILTGVRWKQLRDWIIDQTSDLDQFDDEEYLVGQKALAERILRRLAQERVLKGEKHNGHGYWIVHPGYKVPENMEEISDGGAESAANKETTQANRLDSDTIEVEESPDIDREQQIHADAYTRMTENAVPLRAETRQTSSHPDTPSNKRRRPVEVVDSDVSSCSSSVGSPRRGSNAAWEPLRRLNTPEENRRVSAPSRLDNDNPNEANTPKRRRYGEDNFTAFKAERENSLPHWLITALKDLRTEYLNDVFEFDQGTQSGKCVDCEGRLFSMPVKSGRIHTKNLVQHFNGKQHKDRVAERMSKEVKKSNMAEYSTSGYLFGKDTLLDFPAPDPLQCFSLPTVPGSPLTSNAGEPNLKQLRGNVFSGMAHYMEAVDNHSSAQRLRTTLAEQRVFANEKQCKALENIVATHEESNVERSKRMEEMILDSKMTSRDQATSLEELDGRVRKLASGSYTTQLQIDEMAKALSKSDRKSYELSGRRNEFEVKIKEETRELANRLGAIEGRNEELVDGTLVQMRAHVSDFALRQEEETSRMAAELNTQIIDSEARQTNEFRKAAHHLAAADRMANDRTSRLEIEIQDLAQETAANEDKSASQINRLTTEVQELRQNPATSEATISNQINSVATGIQEIKQDYNATKVVASNQFNSLATDHEETKQKLDITTDQIINIKQDVSTLKRHTKETFTPLMKRVISLERASGMSATALGPDWQTRLTAIEREMKKQDGTTNDLGSQVQIHSDELQRQRDVEDALREGFSAQMAAFAKKTSDHMEEMEKRMNENIEAVQKAGSIRIKELEEVSKEQEAKIRGYDAVFRALFGEQNELAEHVEELIGTVALLKSEKRRPRSPKPHGQGARRRTDGPRPV